MIVLVLQMYAFAVYCASRALCSEYDIESHGNHQPSNCHNSPYGETYLSQSKFSILPSDAIRNIAEYLNKLDTLAFRVISYHAYNSIVGNDDIEQNYYKQKQLIFRQKFINLWNNSNINLSFDDWTNIQFVNPLEQDVADMLKYFFCSNTNNSSVSSSLFIGVCQRTNYPFISFFLRPYTINPSIVGQGLILSVWFDESGIAGYKTDFIGSFVVYNNRITIKLVEQLLTKGISKEALLIGDYRVIVHDKLSLITRIYYNYPIVCILVWTISFAALAIIFNVYLY